MSEWGYKLSKPEDAIAEISARLSKLYDRNLVPQSSSLPIDRATGTNAASSVVGPELASLQRTEIRLHDRATSCDRQVKLADFKKRVRFAYELSFAEENADLVEDLQLPALADAG